jgi:hypothetical protein
MRGRLDRRRFLIGAGVALGFLALPRGAAAQARPLAPETQRALETSRLVYVSPLLADGRESRCHGEVWYFADGGDAVLATSRDGWKARALRRGRDRARLWFGDFGRYRSWRDQLAGAPGCDARARFDPDPAVFERLLAAFAKKYPDEWSKWEPRFRAGVADGSRLVVRYSPIVG